MDKNEIALELTLAAMEHGILGTDVFHCESQQDIDKKNACNSKAVTDFYNEIYENIK